MFDIFTDADAACEMRIGVCFVGISISVNNRKIDCAYYLYNLRTAFA